MPRVTSLALGLAVLTLVLLGLSGCGSPEPTPTAIVPGSSSPGNALPDSLLDESIAVMKDLKSYHFASRDTSTNQQAGGGGLEGDFDGPDKLRMTTTMGSAGKVEVLVIGKDWYTKQPGSDTYVKTESQFPSSSGPVAPHEVLLRIAPAITNTVRLGDEKVDGVDTVHIRADYDTTKAGSLPSEVSSALGPGRGELWIDKNTHYIRQQAFSLSSKPQTTVTKYSKFNEPVVPPIQRP